MSHQPYTVLLYVWKEVPRRRDRRLKGRGRFGHVTLEIKQNSKTVAFLGWWPKIYTVERAKAKGPWLWELIKRKLQRFRVLIWSMAGRRSTFYSVQDALASGRSNISPNEIDTIVASGEARGATSAEWGRVQDWAAYEVSADQIYCLHDVKAKEIVSFIDSFNKQVAEGTLTYSYCRMNCATMSARALQAGHASVRPYWNPPWPFGGEIWEPLHLAEQCRQFACTDCRHDHLSQR